MGKLMALKPVQHVDAEKIQTYGLIETIFGLLKLLLVLGCCLLMFCISAMGKAIHKTALEPVKLTHE